jgi:hypothetical protein
MLCMLLDYIKQIEHDRCVLSYISFLAGHWQRGIPTMVYLRPHVVSTHEVVYYNCGPHKSSTSVHFLNTFTCHVNHAQAGVRIQQHAHKPRPAPSSPPISHICSSSTIRVPRSGAAAGNAAKEMGTRPGEPLVRHRVVVTRFEERAV